VYEEVPLNHESKTEDILFFVFQSVSRAIRVNMFRFLCPKDLFALFYIGLVDIFDMATVNTD
jgi:hypothetical protein